MQQHIQTDANLTMRFGFKEKSVYIAKREKPNYKVRGDLRTILETKISAWYGGIGKQLQIDDQP